MSETTLVLCILCGFPFVFSFIWCFVIGILSFAGGWNRLAKDFASDVPDNLEWLGFQTARLGLIDYKMCMWIAVHERGLYLKTGPAFFYRFMHPPLLIPWRFVKEVQKRALLMFNYAGMKVNGVSILLPLPLLEEIKEKAESA